MNRIIALLSLATLTACTSTKPPALSSGPVTIQGFDANNNPTLTSYAGRTSAGAGMINDTTEAGTISDLSKQAKDGIELGYAHIVKTDVIQPNVDIESKLEQESKDALLDAGKALAAGASGDYGKAMDRAASSGEKLIAIRAAKANAPKPDSGANSARVLIIGKNAGKHTVDAVAHYSDAYKAKQTRATYGSTTDTKTTETTGPQDIAALADYLRAQRMQVEAGRTNIPQVITVPVPMPTPLPAPVGTNTVETIQLPVVE